MLKQAWGLLPSVLTQSLEVLHSALVTLQRGVGLGGLIQEHLQSWNITKGTKMSFVPCEKSKRWLLWVALMHTCANGRTGRAG